MSSGCIASARAVEPTTSAKSTVTRRSDSCAASGSATGAPQAGQKRAPEGSSAPQAVQAATAARVVVHAPVACPPMAEAAAVPLEQQLEEIGTQLAWVRDYL